VRPRAAHTLALLRNQIAEIRGWAGRPAEFNGFALALLYGDAFAALVADPPDYFSALLAHDQVFISSVTDMGNLPDGRPDIIIHIEPFPTDGSAAI
jgi:hypothetical protein